MECPGETTIGFNHFCNILQSEDRTKLKRIIKDSLKARHVEEKSNFILWVIICRKCVRKIINLVF